MYWQLLLLLSFYSGSAEKHSLKYFITSSSGVTNYPEFVAQLVVDNFQGGWCDSNQAQPRNEWAKKIAEENPTEVKDYMDWCLHLTNLYRAYIEDLKQQFNQSGGIHIFQKIHGCEWDDETGEVTGFEQFGYNGEDFISLDPETMTWVAAKPQALITKHKRNSDTIFLQNVKIYHTHICPEKLKSYLQYLQRFQQKTVLPSVFLLQKTPSSPVSCHATGFYPENAVMFWRKDGQKLQEEVKYMEVLPNHDGTFQTSIELRLSSVSPEEWRRYECVFHPAGVQKDIGLILDKAVIRTNWVPAPQFPVGVVVGVVSVLLLLLVSVVGFFIWKRKNNGFMRANSSDSSSQKTTIPAGSSPEQE